MVEVATGNKKASFRTLSWQGAGLILVSAAGLCFEINLTRLFSVAQFYHFAFMVVSIALLGFGASGTFLALRRSARPQKTVGIFPVLAGFSGACMLGAYLLTNSLPFDSFRMAVDPSQAFILSLHYAALASPFFFIGLIISLLLSANPSAGGEVYAVNLLGSAAGCLLAVSLPLLVDGEGVVAVSALMAGMAGILFHLGNIGVEKKGWMSVISILLIVLAVIPSAAVLGFRFRNGAFPAPFELDISPYKSISYALQYPEASIASSRWNSFSRVDVVESPSLHAVPGLSYRYLDPLPPIDGLFVDGDNLNPVLPADADMAFAEFLPAAAAYRLRPGADALILEPLGGIDVLAALTLGVEKVDVVEENPLIIEASKGVYDRDGVRLLASSGRSYLRGSGRRYDIIQLPLKDSYHPVSSGAYSLGEDYRYTVEAFRDMLSLLEPDGLLVVTRWLQEQPSEWLRTFILAVTPLEEAGADPAGQIAAFRSYNTGTLIIKNSAFTMQELDMLRGFAEEKAFDLVYAPGIREAEINRFNVLPEPVYYQTFLAILGAESRNAFYRNYRFNVRPSTDNYPFFGHYFKWSQVGEIIRTLGTTFQPFGGAGYLVILVIFILALILSALLILLPVLVARGSSLRRGNNRIPLYFGLIGLAFMLVEIPLIQRFILYLDHPAYAFTAVLFCVLLFSGLGSRFGSRKLKASTVLLLLVGLLAVYIFLLPPLIHSTLGFPILARLAATIALIAPIGFLMGIPFPGGLLWMRGISSGMDAADSGMVAWVWGVNGASSVVASILASLLALSFGFTAVFTAGSACYLLAWLAIRE